MKKKNTKKTSIMQALEDLKSSGGNVEAVNVLIRQLEENEDLRVTVEKRFKGHLYPNKSLTWVKLQGDVEFSRFLSSNALNILIAMCQNMRHGNLLQISQRKIMKITSINSPKAVVKALEELISIGAIAIRIEGTTHRPTVYMINPAIATVGTEIDKLDFIFWQFADKSDTEGEEYRNPRDKWKALTETRTYSKGYDGQEEGARTVFFNKINEPNLKKSKKKLVEMKDDCKQEKASVTA